MAVGLIEYCEQCGDSWDSGRTSHHFCNPADIARKRERERWPEMSVEEKCEWLKKRIEEVNGSIPFNGPFG